MVEGLDDTEWACGFCVDRDGNCLVVCFFFPTRNVHVEIAFCDT